MDATLSNPSDRHSLRTVSFWSGRKVCTSRPAAAYSRPGGPCFGSERPCDDLLKSSAARGGSPEEPDAPRRPEATAAPDVAAGIRGAELPAGANGLGAKRLGDGGCALTSDGVVAAGNRYSD